jgi:CCR4-NOT transcription complex subunit 1
MTLLVNIIVWLLVPPFLYGYHISALNQIQAVLTCKSDGPAKTPTPSPLPTCIPMNDFAFSLVTAIFTIGGLVGSLFANRVMDSRGRLGASRLSTILIAVGGAILGVSGSVTSFAIGRYACSPLVSSPTNMSTCIQGLL